MEGDNQSDLNLFKSFVLNYAIRRNICEVPSSSLRRFYASLYKTIFKDEKHKDNYFNSIKSYLCRLVSDNKFPTDEVFSKKLMEVNMYKRSKILRMFFNKIENGGNESISLSNLTIEHILPQTPDDDWKKDLGDKFDYIYNTYLHTLGNLSITGYNSRYRNKGFKEKKELLNDYIIKGDVKIIELNKEILDDSITIWNDDVILSRAERLKNIILDYYPYPKRIDKSLVFDDYLKVYIEDIKSELSGDYNLFGFSIKDKIVYCKSYPDLYMKFLCKLYKINNRIIKQMAKDGWKFDRAKSPYISYNRYSVNDPIKLECDSKIYIEYLTKYYVFDAIVCILKLYSNELSVNDFCLLYENK